jgi:Ca2+-dependent lipid-binding protein
MKILLITIVFIPLIIYTLHLGWKINMKAVEKEIKWKVKQWEKKKR